MANDKLCHQASALINKYGIVGDNTNKGKTITD